ncbi:hypothetical protein FHS57_000162 [Runella defluvii]|uniref:VanZ-like domain-containing protein n=1 Tax=Runella defluvii TaxID=370973 RepID=A0A7W5ZFK9_9BACT|nr:hypothetical protein [Runella defluvii]MBB3836180.1 hypothetical protein [Runella defluvii]
MESIDTKKEQKIVATSIVVGMMLYLSKFLRPYFGSNDFVLFILGFLPNFGLAFAIPFIYASNRIRLNKSLEHFVISCIGTFLLMILNEIRDKYQPDRVFDWYDIYASFFGVVFSLFVFNKILKNNSFK